MNEGQSKGTEGGGGPERHRETREQDALGKALQRNTLNIYVSVCIHI